MSGKKGADWYDESDRDKMNFLAACARGMLTEVERCLSVAGVNVDEEDDDGVTALQVASAKGHRSLVEFLLRKGAQVDKANYAGMTPFLHACREGHQDVITVLANHGANIHATTGLGVCAIALACAGRHMTVVRVLRGLNAQLNVASANRPHQVAPSAYMVAFFQMDIEICGFLKKNDANIWYQIRTLNGLNVQTLGEKLRFPPMLMSLNYAESTIKAPKREKDIRVIIQSGREDELDAWIRERRLPQVILDGVTPLMYAAVHGQIRIAEKLIDSMRLTSINVDAQENVLGMSVLMFAIVVGDNQMVQLLLRHNANPRLSSTTKEPFTALDLAHFSNLNQDTLLKLYRHFLRAGKSANGTCEKQGNDASAENNPKANNDIQRRHSGSALARIGVANNNGQKRLRRVIESIGKNIIGLADEFGANGQSLLDPQLESPLPRIRFESMSDIAHMLNAGEPIRFVLAEQILRGDARAQLQRMNSLDTFILLARQMAINWMACGHNLSPMVTFDENLGSKKRLKNLDELGEINGLYSAAQINAERLMKNATPIHRQRRSATISTFHYTQKGDSPKGLRPTQVTPRLRMPNRANSSEAMNAQKSPSTSSRQKVPMSQRTLRKAPHRLNNHQRAASSGSGGMVCPEAVVQQQIPAHSASQPESPQNSNQWYTPSLSAISHSASTNIYLSHQVAQASPSQQHKLYSKKGQSNNRLAPQKSATLVLPPRQKAILTKELVRRMVFERGLTQEFECFGAEEVDELTFATSLHEEEVREVLSRHGHNENGTCQRFLDLIADIKKSTGCSELL